MFEKFKDIVYEISDLLLALVIILVMSVVLTWKITDSLHYPKEKLPMLQESSKAASTAPKNPTTPSEKKTETVTIHIPSGASVTDIAKILKDQGLIENTASFYTRVEALNLAVKLKFGTFKIPVGTDVDDIIYIITRTKP